MVFNSMRQSNGWVNFVTGSPRVSNHWLIHSVYIGKLIDRRSASEDHNRAAGFTANDGCVMPRGAEKAVVGIPDFPILGDLQVEVMELAALLARLEPGRPLNSCCPLAPQLVGRFVDVAAATE